MLITGGNVGAHGFVVLLTLCGRLLELQFKYTSFILDGEVDSEPAPEWPPPIFENAEDVCDMSLRATELAEVLNIGTGVIDSLAATVGYP